MSKIEKTSKVVQKAAETVSGIGQGLREVGFLPPAGGAGKPAPARKAVGTKLKGKRAPTTVAARQYAWRALSYALLLTLGGVFLFLYLLKAEGNVIFLLPAVVAVVFFAFLAGGFKLAYESLRPRAPTPATSRKVATTVDTNPLPPPVIVEAPTPRVPDRAVRSLARLLRHYGGGLRGVPDAEVEAYARAVLAGNGSTPVEGPILALYAPVVARLARVLQLAPAGTPAIFDTPSLLKSFQVALINIKPDDPSKEGVIFPFFQTAATLRPLQSQLTYVLALCALGRIIGIFKEVYYQKDKEGKSVAPDIPATIPIKVFITDPADGLKLVEKVENNLGNTSAREFVEKNIKAPESKKSQVPVKDEDIIKTYNLKKPEKQEAVFKEVLKKIIPLHQLKEILTKDEIISVTDSWYQLIKELPEFKEGSTGKSGETGAPAGGEVIPAEGETAPTEGEAASTGGTKLEKAIRFEINLVLYEVQFLIDTLLAPYYKEKKKEHAPKEIYNLFRTIVKPGTSEHIVKFALDEGGAGDAQQCFDWFTRAAFDPNEQGVKDIKANSQMEHWETPFLNAKKEQSALMQLLLRVTRTLDQNKVTELGAIFLTLMVFLILAWRANLNDEALKISQFVITRGLPEGPPEGEATGYDYWYEVIYTDPQTNKPLPEKVAEYIEISGTRAGDIQARIKAKVERFIKDQAKTIEEATATNTVQQTKELPGLKTQSEVTVMGVDYGQQGATKAAKAAQSQGGQATAAKNEGAIQINTTVHVARLHKGLLEYVVKKFKAIRDASENAAKALAPAGGTTPTAL